MNKNRWLLSTACGLGLLTASATTALAQNVPSENATAPSGTGAATQTITLKPGQESGTNTVLPADTAGNPVASTQDAHFVMQASAGGMAEVMMGHLAMQRGQTQAERNFGQMLVTDHTAANQQLMGIAQTVMLKPAPGPNAMQQSMYQSLQSAPAAQFDMMFNRGMIRAHERTIALFKMEAHDGQNPQLRQFAATSLPVLYKHLRTAEALSPMQGGGMSSMNTMSNGSGMSSMAAGSQGAMTAPVSGNPDHSADQLNARELNAGNPG
jgi:putative membrane protein